MADWYAAKSRIGHSDGATLTQPAAVLDMLAAAFAEGAGDGLPRYRRLYAALRNAILEHRLTPGTRLPSTRDLARELALSRNTVLATFEDLLAEGYIHARTGSGTYVADTATNLARQRGRARAEAPRHASGHAPALSKRGRRLAEYRGGPRFEIQPLTGPSNPDFSLFPIKQWQRLLGRYMRQGGTDLLDYAAQGGHPRLRQAIADTIRVTRAVQVDAERVIVTAGTQHSLDLAAQLLADVGDTVWVEDPGYWGARCIFESCDLKQVPVAVDGDGMNPAAAPRDSAPRLIYLTPSNQDPLGVAMSLPRRRALLELAARHGATILEDDYDAELRYSGRPLASLQGMDGGQRVVYIGTFSKVLYPGIKIGYLVVPPQWVAPFRNALYDLQRPGQLPVQAALADFIERGYYATHVRRLRQGYAQRRDVLLDALQPALREGLRIDSQPAGLHLVLRLPDRADDAALERRAAAQGVTVRALSAYALGAHKPRGLIVGFGYAAAEKLATQGKVLARVLASASL
jgi:GntR family transcriptional regulator/MocR family aminotransferase